MFELTATRAARGAQQVLADAGKETFLALRQAVEGLPQRVRHAAGVHFAWWDTAGAPQTGSTGKAVRSALALLACEAVGGNRSAAVPAAVAVELVHNASLLHDDIIDNDRLRRGRPALWIQLGLPAGILVGDALLFLAIEVLADTRPPLGLAGLAELLPSVQELIDGEYADSLLETWTEVSLTQSQTVATAKTSPLVATACALGALAGGADADRVGHLRAFGAHLGAAYQLIDDLLGILGDPLRTGKSAGSDLQARKKSPPVVAALSADNAAGRELARRYSQRDHMSPADLHHLVYLVQEAGGCAWAVEQAEQHIASGLERLHSAGPEPTAAVELTSLARLIIDRDD
ncbi:polyprenyl synthetase family protein [Nocardia sp. CA-107356]|uniref:polyprenyl synthetase family protein n=1 Tax=Nocardia sp. CA-107356 TaxID=3239972 RepID=UPI003D8CC96F